MKIGALLEKLKDATPTGVNPCLVLAEIVNAGKCDLWVGDRRTGHNFSIIEQMLSQLALYGRDNWQNHMPIAHRDSSRSQLRAIDLTDAELRLSDVQRGARARCIALPAGLGRVAPSRNPDQLIERLFLAAVSALGKSTTASISLKAARKWITNLSPTDRERFGVKTVKESARFLRIKDSQSAPHQLALTSLGRYFTKAKKTSSVS